MIAREPTTRSIPIDRFRASYGRPAWCARALAAFVLFLLAAAPALAAAPGARGSADWIAYAHDAGGSKHSPAAQINRDNVYRLVPVWSYRTGDYGLGAATARDETTPIVVDGVLYASTPFGGVRALDPASGLVSAARDRCTS